MAAAIFSATPNKEIFIEIGDGKLYAKNNVERGYKYEFCIICHDATNDSPTNAAPYIDNIIVV